MAVIDWEPYVSNVHAAAAADLDALEARLGVVLPSDYRDMALLRQGQAPTLEEVPISDGSTVFGPLLILTGQRGDANYTYSVARGVESLREWSGVSDDKALKLFPFATNTASGLFCFDYRHVSGSPRVVFIDLGYDPDEAGAVTPVAESFSATLAKLR